MRNKIIKPILYQVQILAISWSTWPLKLEFVHRNIQLFQRYVVYFTAQNRFVMSPI